MTKIKRTEVVVPIKYLSNFWRSLDLSLIECKIELDLRWARNCVISEISRASREVDPNADPVEYEVATLTNVPAFIEDIKQGFKRTIPWFFSFFLFIQKMVLMMLLEILLMSTICHYHNSKILMH